MGSLVGRFLVSGLVGCKTVPCIVAVVRLEVGSVSHETVCMTLVGAQGCCQLAGVQISPWS